MAILDSGADATSYPNYVVIERLDHLATNHRPVDTQIQIIYGNGERVSIDRMVNHGLFDILITPDHRGECLISTDQLNSTGHVVTMTTMETIIADTPENPGTETTLCHWTYFTASVNYEGSTQ